MSTSFAIATPLKNGWPFIRANVASVRAQRTSGSGMRIRHVVQESGASTDESSVWLAQQADVLAQSACDSGMYDAINKALAQSSEDVVAWLNADEQYLPGALASVAGAFALHPGADIVFGDYLLLNGDLEPISARREIPARLWYTRHGVNYIMSCATFIRRSAWERLGGLDASLKFLADKDLYLRAMLAGMRLVHVRRFLGAYACTGANLSLSRDAVAEQAKLRDLYGAYKRDAARMIPRALRCAEKALRGCYGKARVRAALFDKNGDSRNFDVRLDCRWRWQ